MRVSRADPGMRSTFARLGDRRSEIRRAILDRVRAIGPVPVDLDASYQEGLRLAVESAIDHWIEGAGRDQDLPFAIPAPLLTQARLAARKRVPLEVVLRRYLAGHAVLGDFLVEEAAAVGLTPPVLRGLLRASAAETDRVLAELGAAYASESASAHPTVDERRAKQVRRLLDGELVDPASIGYDLDLHHLGFVVRGARGAGAIAEVAAEVGAAHLVAAGEEALQWWWLGWRAEHSSDRPVDSISARLPDGARLGVGEPLAGDVGWRLTHRQARAALSVADRSGSAVARYAEVAVLASTLEDDLLSASLKTLYLDRLDAVRGDGEVLRATLKAYFETDRSISSAAALLGVNRNTVTNRIRSAEAMIGPLRPPHTTQIALALRLEEMGRAGSQN
jgi:DNA-binding PucR family transcriptional regulator